MLHHATFDELKGALDFMKSLGDLLDLRVHIGKMKLTDPERPELNTIWIVDYVRETEIS
jgi:hypothetical protein